MAHFGPCGPSVRALPCRPTGAPGRERERTGAAFVLHLRSVDRLVITPAAATVAAGRPQSFTIRGLDAAGNDLGDFTDWPTFSARTADANLIKTVIGC